MADGILVVLDLSAEDSVRTGIVESGILLVSQDLKFDCKCPFLHCFGSIRACGR